MRFETVTTLIYGNRQPRTRFPKTRADYLEQFADWLDSPTIRAQRLRDDPRDHRLRTYYHWIQRGVDFVSLDNASIDQFDDAQVSWIERTLARDETDGCALRRRGYARCFA